MPVAGQGLSAHIPFECVPTTPLEGSDASLEKVVQEVVHLAQAGFVRRRRMGDNILRSPAAMGAPVVVGAEWPCTTLFDIMAAFPSVSWAWIAAVLEAVDLPRWTCRAVGGLMENSSAEVFLNGQTVARAACVARRGIRQGCPSSHSL